MFAASKTAKAAAAAAPTDPQFNYVTMLLHGDGTNGAQNNTFLDSSTNNFTITRNGNTTQGTFSPYGSNWSNNFNGSTGYLTVPSSSLFKPASSNFTIEAWVFVANTGAQQQVYGDCDSGTNNGICLLAVSSALKVQVDYFTSSTAVVTKTTTGSIQANAWNHICVSKTGTTMYIGYNGTLETFTGIPSTMQSPSTIYPTIARLGAYNGLYVNGYISNFRYVIGSAVYTGSTYTVPTSPLTAISGTSILTCADNRFIDDSSNALTITVNGTPSVQRFSPFNPTSAYSTSVIGGSGYFDGTGDYLTLPSNSCVVGANDFTLEAWVFIPDRSADYTIFNSQTNATTAAGSSYGLEINTAGVMYSYYYVGSTTYNITSTGTVPLNAWSHVVLARTGGTISLFINGVRDGTRSDLSTSTINAGATNYPPGIGINAIYTPFKGYISNFRLLIGSGGYNAGSSTITVPTAPLTAVTNTQVLSNFTNAGILDNAMMNDLETVGNAQISTSVKKYGTGSMAFDGTDDRLTTASSPNIAFGTGDFTVEAWVYTNVLVGERGFIQTSATVGGLQTSYTNGVISTVAAGAGSYTFNCNIAGTNIGGSVPVTTGTWYHVAFTRSSGSVRLFINGTLAGGPTTITANLDGQNICVGGYYSTGYLWNGYVDDLRITKGYARYTSSFTPPTAAFPNN
jgi:hypothetical protein